MKKSKQLLSLFMALVLVFGAMFTMTAYADDTTDVGADSDSNAVTTGETSEPTPEGTQEFSVWIQGISDSIYMGAVEAELPAEGALTAADVLKALDEKEEGLTITFTESDYGAYVSAVNDEAENTFGKYDGWMYMVDGVIPRVGIYAFELNG